LQNSRSRDVAVFVDGIHIGLDLLDLRLGVHPAVAGGYERLGNIAYGPHDVPPFILRKQRMTLALEKKDVLIVSDDDIQIAEGGYLLAKADVAGVKPIVTTGGHNLLASGGLLRRRRREPGKVVFSKYTILDVGTLAEGSYRQGIG